MCLSQSTSYNPHPALHAPPSPKLGEGYSGWRNTLLKINLALLPRNLVISNSGYLID
jgi:hypothetical protein